MTASMTVIRNDNTVEHDKPLLLEQVEIRAILEWHDFTADFMSPAGRDKANALARKLAVSIGEPDRYPELPARAA